MAIQDMDMDICLNITTEPVIPQKKKKQKRTESFKTSIEKSKSLSLRKSIVVDNSESKRDIHKKEIENRKRIKQKSLSTIFAKKLKQVGSGTLNAQKHVKFLPQEKNKIQTDKNEQSDTLKKTDLKLEQTIINNDTTKTPFLSFTKTTKEHFGTTLLAKERDTLKDEQKKSLSAIFSNKSENQDKSSLLTTIHKSYIDKNSVSKEQPILYKKLPTFNDKKELDINKIEKKKNEKIVHKINKKSFKAPRLIHKSAGKVSSLFGNNPEIPNIGQRFVKPVNESVFTEINFVDLDIHPFTISNLKQNMCITKMTTVQQLAIPQIFSGKDILIRSQTGSGKTLAYALPIIESLHKIRPKLHRNSGLSALIVVPTRELVLQTYECFVKLVKPFTWIVSGYLIGGEKRKSEKARLRKGCNILIATPGRLLDHIKHTAALRLKEVKYFVLDEADRMLDMGYEKDISGIVSALKMSSSGNDKSNYDPIKILKQNINKGVASEEINTLEEKISKENDIDPCNIVEGNDINTNKEKQLSNHDSGKSENYTVSLEEKDRTLKHPNSDSKINNIQTILLSATLTQTVEKLAGLTMQNPIFVDAAKKNLEVNGGDISEVNEDLIVPQSVFQTYIVTPPKLRIVSLSAYIVSKCQISGQNKILIFMATQDMVDYHTDILSSVLTKPVDEDDEDSDPLVDIEFFKLHGNMTQKERTEIFKIFRQAKSGVLLCTDVAARGLDMPKVDCVVQYTGPISARDYVHRIGRTARAGCSGKSTIFLTPPEIDFVRLLESRRIRIKQEDMNDVLDKLLILFPKHNSVQEAATALQNDFENLVLENQQFNKKACKAYISWMRFYSSYPRDMREIFNRKELHLGHYAKSFALRDPPRRIGGISTKLHEEDNSKPRHDNRLSNKSFDGVPQKEQKDRDGNAQRVGLLKRVRMLNTSEYDSGLEPVKKRRK